MKHNYLNNVVAQYSLYSLFFTVIFSFVLGNIFTGIIEKYIIETHIRLYPNIIQNALGTHDLSSLEREQPNLEDKEIIKYLEDFIAQNDVVYLKLWGKENNILWSNNKELIGKTFENEEYGEALSGKLAYEIKSKSDREENSSEISGDETFEFYIPIFQGKEVVGVFEVYERNRELIKSISYSSGKIWAIVAAVMSINYLLLFFHFYHSNKKYVKATFKLNLTQNVTILALAHQAELRDKETGFHLVRTVEYVRQIALEAKKTRKYENYITDKYIEDMLKAAPLHDIGKVGVSDSILLKPAKLTEAEFSEVKKHCRYGTETLLMAKQKLGFETFLDIAVEVVHYHHEKWDGTGYPSGLKGEEIPLSARIMALADVYDALVSARVYKEAYSHEKAVEIIKEESGKQFDPFLVELFLNISDVFKQISEDLSDLNHKKDEF